MPYRPAPQEVERAPAPLRPALSAVAQLYALTRIRRSLACYMSAGLLNRADAVALRTAVHELYGALTAAPAGGWCAALALCDAFGIPDHLLQAPIATNWRKI